MSPLAKIFKLSIKYGINNVVLLEQVSLMAANYSLDDLRYFCTIVKLGSFKKASAKPWYVTINFKP